MGLLDFMRPSRRTSQKNIQADERAHYASLLDGINFSVPMNSCGLTDAMTISTFYRCLTLISETISSLPLYLYRGRDFVDNDFSRKMNTQPTNTLSRNDFYKKIVADILGHGNAFAEIKRKDTKVERLVYLDPTKVTVQYDAVNDKVSYTVEQPTGKARELEDYEILHFKNNLLGDFGVIGKSVVEDAWRTLAIARQEDESANRFFAGNNVRGVLSYNQRLSEEQKDQIKDAYRTLMMSKVPELLVIGSDANYSSIAVNAADAELLSSRMYSVEEICRFFGINPQLLSPQKTSYASQSQAMLEFLTNCIGPRIESIETELNRKLLLPSEQTIGYHFAFDTNSMLRLSKNEQASYFATLSNIGALSINEIRDELGYPAIEGGDTPRIPLNTANVADDPYNNQNNETNNEE